MVVSGGKKKQYGLTEEEKQRILDAADDIDVRVSVTRGVVCCICVNFMVPLLISPVGKQTINR